MTKILKGSTCQPEEIHEEQRVERLQEFRTREFWNKPPLERSQITVEWLKKRIEYFHVTPEQVAIYTRMDLPRLKEILDDTAMLGLGEFCDIFHAISSIVSSISSHILSVTDSSRVRAVASRKSSPMVLSVFFIVYSLIRSSTVSPL